MKLIPNFKEVAFYSYSAWANYLGLICLILPEALFYFWALDTDPRLWWFSGMGLLVFGTIGRHIEQPRVRSVRRMIALSIFVLALIFAWSRPLLAQSTPTTFLVVAVPLVAKWEGKENHAYLDRIASPPVWTICYGETRGVKVGDYRTDTQCANMLKGGLIEYRVGLHKYFNAMTKAARLPATRDAAYVSLAWNAGIAGIGRSTATKRLNAGNIAGGCYALTWWNKAGSRVVRGLVNRRADDYATCMIGVT